MLQNIGSDIFQKRTITVRELCNICPIANYQKTDFLVIIHLIILRTINCLNLKRKICCQGIFLHRRDIIFQRFCDCGANQCHGLDFILGPHIAQPFKYNDHDECMLIFS